MTTRTGSRTLRRLLHFRDGASPARATHAPAQPGQEATRRPKGRELPIDTGGASGDATLFEGTTVGEGKATRSAGGGRRVAASLALRSLVLTDAQYENVAGGYPGLLPNITRLGRLLSADQVKRLVGRFEDEKKCWVRQPGSRTKLQETVLYPKAQALGKYLLHASVTPEERQALVELLPPEQRSRFESMHPAVSPLLVRTELAQPGYRETYSFLVRACQSWINRSLESYLCGTALSALQIKALLHTCEPQERFHMMEILASHWSGKGDPELVTCMFPGNEVRVRAMLRSPVTEEELASSEEPVFKGIVQMTSSLGSSYDNPIIASMVFDAFNRTVAEAGNVTPSFDAYQLRCLLTPMALLGDRLTVLEEMVRFWNGEGDKERVLSLFDGGNRARAASLLA